MTKLRMDYRMTQSTVASRFKRGTEVIWTGEPAARVHSVFSSATTSAPTSATHWFAAVQSGRVCDEIRCTHPKFARASKLDAGRLSERQRLMTIQSRKRLGAYLQFDGPHLQKAEF